MKLAEIHKEVVKAVEKVVGPMRPIDLSIDTEIDDFTAGTANGHVKEFENENIYVTCDLSDPDYPAYLILTLSKGAGYPGYSKDLVDETRVSIDDDIYTDNDLEQAVKNAQEIAQAFVKEMINAE